MFHAHSPTTSRRDTLPMPLRSRRWPPGQLNFALAPPQSVSDEQSDISGGKHAALQSSAQPAHSTAPTTNPSVRAISRRRRHLFFNQVRFTNRRFRGRRYSRRQLGAFVPFASKEAISAPISGHLRIEAPPTLGTSTVPVLPLSRAV